MSQSQRSNSILKSGLLILFIQLNRDFFFFLLNAFLCVPNVIRTNFNYFYGPHLKPLKIALRVGVAEKRALETIAERPPRGPTCTMKSRDGLCCVGINVGRRLQSHVHEGISHSGKFH